MEVFADDDILPQQERDAMVFEEFKRALMISICLSRVSERGVQQVEGPRS